MKVWVVQKTLIYTGSRIEAYETNYSIFTDKDKALQFAWKIAKEYRPNYNPEYPSKFNPKYNNEGCYVYREAGGYHEWPAFKIDTEEKELDFNNDVILNLQTSN